MEEEIKPREKPEGILERVLTLVGGFGPLIFYSTQMYNLMGKAGYYRYSSQPPAYPEMNTADYNLAIAAISMGSFALLGGGMYVGSKIGRFLDKKLKKDVPVLKKQLLEIKDAQK